MIISNVPGLRKKGRWKIGFNFFRFFYPREGN
jgi:hypothetical protein